MQIDVTFRHMDVTESLRDHALDKIEHDFSDFPKVEYVHVILDVEKHRHIAEVVVQAKNHIRVEAKEESDNMYYSIDHASERAAKQIRKHRDKKTDHKRGESIAEVEKKLAQEKRSAI